MRGLIAALVLSVVCTGHLGYGLPMADGFEKRGIPARASFNIIDPTSDTTNLTPSAAAPQEKRMDTNPPIPAEGKPLAALEDKRGIPARASFNIIDPTSDTADLQPGAVIKGDKRGIPARASFTILDPTSDTSELKAETA